MLAAYKRRMAPDIRQRVREFQIGHFRWLVDIPCNLLFGRNLKMLATIYGADKWNSHWYVQHYEHHFNAIRRKRLTVLEIGVGGYQNPRCGGNSLRMWRAYFPKAHIYGVDLYDKTPHNERRITTLRGSQTDPRFLDSLFAQVKEPDIIIDDGSHVSADVIATFTHIFPCLKLGGYYVIEDTQTSYWPEEGNPTDRNDLRTTMGFFKTLIDGLNYEEFVNEYDPTYYDRHITSMTFYHNLIVIRKGLNEEGSNIRRAGQSSYSAR